MRIGLYLAAAMLSTLAAPLAAQTANNSAPAGARFALTGLPQSTTFQQFQFSFTATSSSTFLTFAFRNDPQYIALDDVSMTLGGGPNLVVNGGFEAGPNGSSTPTGWTYLNQYGASAGGAVSASGARTGTFGYYDGAVGSYDAITQSIATTSGSLYNVSFYERVTTLSAAGALYRETSGGTAATAAVDMFVYVGNAVPVASVAPEPGAWALMIGGFGIVGGTARRRRKRVAFAA